MKLTQSQQDIITAPFDTRIFLSGPSGCGKTTVGVERMRYLLEQGVYGESILVLTPQRTLQEPYQELLQSPEIGAGGQVTLATVGGLARRMVDLFWPLAAEAAGFANPDQPPIFLTLETAQYYMAHIVRPLLDEGYFESLTINRNRLYSQVIDNLNKAAAIGFPHTQIGERLDKAWLGDPSQRRIYQDTQDCANRFRAYCLEHNLLDFSLQLEIFWEHLWGDPIVQDYLTRTYRHLIYDNIEEDIPRAHDLIRGWIPDLDSALLIYDENAGYRRFLGADPETAWRLSDICSSHASLNDSFVASEDILALSDSLAHVINPASTDAPLNGFREGVLQYADAHFYPELLDWLTEEISTLLEEGIEPADIVVLAPYLSDALRFSLMHRLETRGIPVRSHRPSRSLRDEPATQSLLTLAALAHPQWGIRPSEFDVAYALMQAIDGFDLIRANLLTKIVYRARELALSPFDGIKPDVQERITYVFGGYYTQLREWLLSYQEQDVVPFDHFLRKLFGEILSQPGFGFHRDLDSARVAASLIESVKKFRWAMASADTDALTLGREYIDMLSEGVIAAQYLGAWKMEEENAVLVAPAYTFLMQNRAVAVQFWLNPGSDGWVERLFQPLTHPYVLSRSWDNAEGHYWTDADDVAANQATLARLTTGLLRRCKERLYLGLSELGESGFEQRGVLLKAFQRVLQEMGDR
ncbi:MAG: ATP-dependent helicase [Anaerolineae bacterium]|jgi:superfamily I DNA/RNA helicase|nr:ATP-dependent helicase [Anaerolineae bacterium]MBT7070248.1 ATP-dependent helicase [Anaerolineae bacterium]MBT7325320.1 ATP-dependent helicase [Anaerolineae bacterium]